MDRRHVVLLALASAIACSNGDAPPPAAKSGGTTTDSAGGNVTAAPAADAAPAAGAPAAGGSSAANPRGRIPVLEYHVIGGEKNTLYTRTAASYRLDLEEAYKRGYRPVTIAQLLDKDFRDVPAGMAPVVLVFDDASDSQFRYLEQGGKLVVDPTSGLGILEEFA
nr:hypothetical protein [Gemmatimonadaceae bacterium]